MISCPVKKEGSVLLFPVIKKIPISIGETIGLKLFEGRNIFGIVDEICVDGEHFWLRTSPNSNSYRERFSFKIDQIVKLN